MTMKTKVALPVIAVERSANRKLGECSATYVSQESCPADCPLLGNGCYAESGWTAFTTRRANRSPIRQLIEIARREAREIDRLSGDLPLRLHVVGDSTTRTGTRLLASAAARYRKWSGSKVWTYTHGWQHVSRSDWGSISVLASCESTIGVRKAQRRGYATALVVVKFESEKMYEFDGVRIIPCPNQTKGVTCAECRLCQDDARLKRERLTIGFEAHGRLKGKVQRFALKMAE